MEIEAPTAMSWPPTVTEKELVVVAVDGEFPDGETVTAGVELDAPEDAAGAIAVPMGASAAAPSMMIDTTMASHTAPLRGDMGGPFTHPSHLNLWPAF